MRNLVHDLRLIQDTVNTRLYSPDLDSFSRMTTDSMQVFFRDVGFLFLFVLGNLFFFLLNSLRACLLACSEDVV